MEQQIGLLIIIIHWVIAVITVLAIIIVPKSVEKWAMVMGATAVMVILDALTEQWLLVLLLSIAIFVELGLLIKAIRKANGPRIKGFIIASQITRSEIWYLNKHHVWEPNELSKTHVFSDEEKDRVLKMAKDNNWRNKPSFLIPAVFFKGVTKVTGGQMLAYPVTELQKE